MKKRRTRKDKIIAQLRRKIIPPTQIGSETSFSYKESGQDKGKSLELKNLSDSLHKEEDFLSLFSYDPSLIQKDLVKTVILSIIAFITLFVLYQTTS